ncbi:hypothetical protein [Crenothrix sp.]|uniref:hypothetical protein n=1 Tax=Crenothrix sp. TaxID=3100433 RepID=UPI00374CB202
MKNSFYLVIPKQQNEPLRLKEFEAKALQQWLDELLAGDFGSSTLLIQNFVMELNTLVMPTQLRLAVLKKITPIVYYIENILLNTLLKTGFPKDGKEKKIFELLIAIQKACALGYWIVLKELMHRDASWYKEKDTGLALQLCVKKLGRIVISHYIMKMSVPAWLWLDLHSLYKLSLKRNHIVTKIVTHLNQYKKARSTEDCYKQILLMSLADPSGLNPKEILLVFKVAGSLAALVSLQSTHVIQQNSQCAIQTDEDEPPYFRTNVVGSVTDAYTRYFDFTLLYQSLDYQEKRVNVGDAEFSTSLRGISHQIPTLSAELLSYLRQRWTGVEFQGSPLFVDRRNRYIGIGLFSIRDLSSAAKADKIEVDFSSKEQREPLLAQSISDKLLSAKFNEVGVLSVGSLVSFRKQSEPECKQALGIVNKVSVVSHDNRIVFGVALIARHFCIVFCKRSHAADEDIAKEVSQRGAFYSHDKLKNEKDYVITDYPFEDNERVNLSMERSRKRENFPVILKNRKNIASGYWHFECHPIAEHSRPKPDTALLRSYA